MVLNDRHRSNEVKYAPGFSTMSASVNFDKALGIQKLGLGLNPKPKGGPWHLGLQRAQASASVVRLRALQQPPKRAFNYLYYMYVYIYIYIYIYLCMSVCMFIV